jgi:hypothetical protein
VVIPEPNGFVFHNPVNSFDVGDFNQAVEAACAVAG